jgi:hypothetical protein
LSHYCAPSHFYKHRETESSATEHEPSLEDAVSALRLQIPKRSSRLDRGCWLALPYGRWICADGRQVQFNRAYQPIWQRHLEGGAERAHPEEWVRWIHQEWFYGGAGGPLPPARSRETRKRLLTVLSDFGVRLGKVEMTAREDRKLKRRPTKLTGEQAEQLLGNMGALWPGEYFDEVNISVAAPDQPNLKVALQPFGVRFRNSLAGESLTIPCQWRVGGWLVENAGRQFGRFRLDRDLMGWCTVAAVDGGNDHDR